VEKQLRISLQKADGSRLPSVTVRVQFRPSGKIQVLCTDNQGELACTLSRGTRTARLEIGPVPGHWSIGEDVALSEINQRVLHATALPDAVDGLGWWHRVVGVHRRDPTLGRGIRIGVIDTGCAPHPALAHVTPLGTFVSGQGPNSAVNDELEHGTHVCGILGARTNGGKEFIGLAPAAELLVARVETAAKQGVKQDDIADAIDAMVDRRVHLINISFGARAASRVLIDSIINAWLHGVVCFAAAGNLGGPVLWPAQHEKVIAVTALGRRCELPEGSLAALLLSDSRQTDSDLDMTFAEFCSRGPQTDCCSPGIGIISTVGTATGGSWGDMSGTSMASPLALATLAGILADDLEYRNTAEDERRSERALELMQSHCRPLALDTDVQGNGLLVFDF